MTRMARVNHIGMVASLLALALLLGIWTTVLAPPANAGFIAPVLLLLILPLLIALRGLLHGRRYTAAWTGLLSIFYLTYGIAQIPDPQPVRTLAIACTLLATLLFASTVYYVRLTGDPAARGKGRRTRSR
jgi:uncharacterized membrane protein